MYRPTTRRLLHGMCHWAPHGMSTGCFMGCLMGTSWSMPWLARAMACKVTYALGHAIVGIVKENMRYDMTQFDTLRDAS